VIQDRQVRKETLDLLTQVCSFEIFRLNVAITK